MRLIVLTAALALACASSAATARPRHHVPDVGKKVGCSQPDMRPCGQNFKPQSDFDATGKKSKVAKNTAGRPRAWCGWWLGRHLGKLDRRLWRAREWATIGVPAGGPGKDVIVVWPNHVGIITGHTPEGYRVLSGNDGNAVRERVRSLRGAIAFRRL